MHIDPIFERAFSNIYGKPAWRVSPGWGSFVTFQFGDPHLDILEPVAARGKVSDRAKRTLAQRHVFLIGEWHLWINCCDWEVTSAGIPVGKSTAQRSIQAAADCLDGQKLIRFCLDPEPVRCTFEFDLGGRLETHPYDDTGEQWIFHDRRAHTVLILRADGMYSFRPDERAIGPEWKSVWQT